MAAPYQELPLVARGHLVEQVLDRLMRPDDVRELPKRFIQPGFYGIGGVGKSRLLREIEARARSITPYVVSINFDRRQAAYVPGTPWDLLRYLVAQLAEIDRCCRNPWQRLRWATVNPFCECGRIMAEAGPLESASQSIVAIGSHVEDVNMAIAQPIPPNLEKALDEALTHLGVRVKVRRQFGGLEAKPRPLVVILLDTLETASKPLRAWLPTHFLALFTHNLLWYHVLIVAASRQQMPGLITTELPPFTEAESIEFLRHYYVHQQSVDRRFADPALQRALREDTPTRRAILELAEGIPLLLMLLAELAAHKSGQLFAAPEGPPPEGQQARLNYVVEHYIRRLEVEAQDDREAAERYRLLLYNAVPRRIPNDGLIAALLRDLPGMVYPAGPDSRALFNRLRRESFVHEDAAGGLVFHEVVREGFLAHLKASDRQRWRELHRRAAAWWQAEGDEVEALYHAVQADYEGVIGDLRRRIEAALEAKEWSQAQALIGATTELDLQPADQAWMTLYKAGTGLGRRQPSSGLSPPGSSLGPGRAALRCGRPLGRRPGAVVQIYAGDGAGGGGLPRPVRSPLAALVGSAAQRASHRGPRPAGSGRGRPQAGSRGRGRGPLPGGVGGVPRHRRSAGRGRSSAGSWRCCPLEGLQRRRHTSL